jgi:PAS domain S-box-containing protein
VRLLTNPIFVRMAAAFLIAIAAFVAGIMGLRILRRRIIGDDVLADNPGQENTLYPYSVVIQQLKQQKFELQTEQQTQRRRAKTSEQITSAVIANLPCGVLFIGSNGLIKQANAAARRILGFASPLGMGLDELFRDASYVLHSGESGRIADLFRKSLRGQSPPPFEGRYCMANGEERALRITLIPLSAPSGETLGVASVITDESSTADSRRAQLLHGEISAEMALELRGSLAAIRESAQRMSATNDQRSLTNFATDISSEAERLERLVGGFLAESGQAKASVARA